MEEDFHLGGLRRCVGFEEKGLLGGVAVDECLIVGCREERGRVLGLDLGDCGLVVWVNGLKGEEDDAVSKSYRSGPCFVESVQGINFGGVGSICGGCPWVWCGIGLICKVLAYG